MSRHGLSGEFIAGAKGPIFVLLRRPPRLARNCVLVVPPFAEEMNKCRRMVTEAALQLVGRGVAVVLPDLHGTGDSGGDFSEATWQAWLGDLTRTAKRAAEQGHAVTGILAIRLGCALATGAIVSGALPAVARSALWQPVFDGSRFLTQFLRLRLAANFTDDRKESLAELRHRLAAGEALEVSGYRLSGRLAADLDSLIPPMLLPTGLGEAAWFEAMRDKASGLAPPSQALIAQTRERGGSIRDVSVTGEPFWTSTEIVVIQELVAATVAHLSGPATPGDV